MVDLSAEKMEAWSHGKQQQLQDGMNPESLALANLTRICNLPSDCSYLSKMLLAQASSPLPSPNYHLHHLLLSPNRVSVCKGKRELGGPMQHYLR